VKLNKDGTPQFLRIRVAKTPWEWELLVIIDTGPVQPSIVKPPLGPGPRLFRADKVSITERNDEDISAHYEWYEEGELVFEFRAQTVKDDGASADLCGYECFCENRSTLF